jgi:hypothetical protein
VDGAPVPRPRPHRGRDPVGHGVRRAAEVLRLRHHLRDQQRVRLRLPSRQHADGGPRRRPLPEAPAAEPGPAPLRDRRRGRQHPRRRGADAADHLRPRPRRRRQVLPRRPDRPSAQGRAALRGQGEGAHRGPHRGGRADGREARRRGELLHRRQHGVAAPHRQRPQGPSPLQARRQLRGAAGGGGDRRRVHRPPDARPAVVRRPPPGRRGEGGRAGQGGVADARHGHAAELLQALQEGRRHDRHGHDRGHRVLEDLQARRDRHPSQPRPAADQPSRRHLPHRAGEMDRRRRRGGADQPLRHAGADRRHLEGGHDPRRGRRRLRVPPQGRAGGRVDPPGQGEGNPASRPAGARGHGVDREERAALRTAREARRRTPGAQRQAPQARGRDHRPGRPARRRDDRHQHGRPRHRHHSRRQPRDDGLGETPGHLPHAARRAQGGVGRAGRRDLGPREHEDRGGDGPLDGRPADHRHGAARGPAHRPSAPRPLRPAGRPASSSRSKTT